MSIKALSAEPRSDTAPSLQVGDLVRTGENRHPHYQVIAVSADRAWLRDVQCGADHIVPVARCRGIGAELDGGE